MQYVKTELRYDAGFRPRVFPIAGGISKILVKWEGESKSFLPAADFHGHELKVLVKMCTTGKKKF